MLRGRVSVIIPAKNASETLEACVRSLVEDLDRTQVDYEVFLIDDVSTDGAPQVVAGRFPQITLIRNSQALGYARANNVGLRAATGDAILLLNADTVVAPGCISALLDALRRHPGTAAVGPTLLNPDGTIQRSCWRFPLRSIIGNTLWLFRTGLWDDYRSWDHRCDREVDWISSAALMIRRSAVEVVGLLNERFWVYGVDIDWAMRARRRGFRFLSVAAGRVVHRGGSSWGEASDRQYADHMRSQALLFQIHYGWPGLAFFRAVVFGNSLIRFIAWSLASLLGFGQAKRKAAEFARLLRWSMTGRVGSSERSSTQRVSA